MGKITKPMQPKHKETLSPWLKSYVESASTTPLPLLPQKLASFPSRWPFGRGDLYHWIPLLNRFDSLLEYFCATYKLSEHQARDFGCDVLLNEDKESAFSNERQWSMKELTELGFPSDGDRQLLEVILRFTRMLLEHCGNRSIYASSAHLNDLLNTTSLTVLIATLEVGSELAQRYQASVKRIGNASRQISTALLANHYNIDLDRVQQLALPFVKTPMISLSDPVTTHTPGSAKGKERQQGSSSKAVTSMHANDLVALASSDDKRWTGWGDVKVFYYPQNAQQEPIGAAEPGRASMPSTPTPLRRSSTMTSQHQTPRSRNHSGEDSSPLGPRTPGLADESVATGPKTFELPQTVVASNSVYELASRCPDDLPPASKYEAFHRIRASKALLGSRESRQQLLAVRLLAITNLAYIHTESNFVEKVLRQDADETRRFQLVYQLAELIHPTAHGNIEVPLWLQAVALALLEAVSNFHARCQDVLSALNANVNHGILLYVIRKAVAGMKDEDDGDKGSQVTEMDEWRNNLFSLTLHLCMATRVGSEMVSAGLMEILVEILHIRSGVAQRNHSMVLAFLDGLIWTYQNAFTAFFNAKGLDAVAQLVVDTVEEAQTLHKSGRGITKGQQSSAVDYEIPYYQQQTLKWLLKFVHHIMSNSYSYSGNTDRLLRNLADKSDLLRSLRDIMEDKKSFGSIVWTNSVTILSDFINNDPTSFAAISESGMIKTYLEAITGRPLPSYALEEQKSGDKEDDGPDSPDSTVSSIVERDSRQHPPTEDLIRQMSRESLASGILPSVDAITVVPQVLNSISLNNAGMKMVVASRAFDSFLEIFESPDHVRSMEVDADLSNNVGASFDELARHHPPLRRAIANAVIDMVARVRFLGIEKARTAGWGARMLLIDRDGKTVSLDEEGNLRPLGTSSDKDSGPGASGDADVDMADGVPSGDPVPEIHGGNGPDSPRNSITPYIFALGSFLSSYMANSVLKAYFVEDGGLELLLDICESPSLPTSFGDSLACRIFSQVISQLVETSAIRGLPSLLQRTQSTIDVLQPLTANTDTRPPYFTSFLMPGLPATHPDPEVAEELKNGTKMIKALLNAQTYIKMVSDSFQTTRSNALQFYPINVYDYYLNLVKSIGPLLRGVLSEEAGELNIVPQNWSLRRHAPSPDGSSGGNNPEPETDDNTSLPDMLSTTRGFQSKKGPGDVNSGRPTEEEQASPRFQNYETLRLLLHPMIPTTFPLFQTLGKALIPRREREPRDPYLRPRHLEIARALADTVLCQLRSSVATPQPTSKEFHFWIIMLHTITEMLIDHSSNRPHDRSGAQIIMPVLLAFKEEGGMDVLNSMLKVFAQAIRQRTEVISDESSKAKVAAFGLKKILDLYLTLVDDKYLSESSNHFALQPRGPDRSQSTPHLDQQLVVEFRAAILPEITDLWDSNFAEKVPHQTVSRLLDILKIISAGENEAPATTRDKPPFQLFKYTDVRFDWGARRGTIDDLLSKGHSPELVHEAVYRALGNPVSSREYCTAHTAGLAGPRNPIPSKDSDTSVLQEAPKEPSSANDGELPSVAAAPEPDRMSLDEPPELDSPDLSGRLLGDALGEIIDRPQAADDAREAPSTTADTPLQQPESPVTAPGATAGDHAAESSTVATRENMDKCRAKLRASMIDRCLDVIRAHPETAIEVSDLIRTMTLQQGSSDTQDDVGPTLTSALSSLALDEEDEKKRNGKCIAAYAHLLALLLQDERFFENNIESLREGIDEYVGFLKMPPSTTAEEMPQWIPYILLVIEILLCHDERPVAAQWKAPKSLDEAVAEPIIQMRTPLIDDEQRAHILESLLEMLPRVGKEETLAVAALRVLVILTRNRRLAKLVGDKKNLQRLFLMAKQLSGSGSERFKQTKLTAHIMTILRHIVEDEETIKQIMRAEIKASFPTLQRTQRGHSDVSNYLRAMAPIALRAPDLFVDVTHEMLRFTRWASSSGETSRSQSLVLKESNSEQSTETTDERSQPTEGATLQDIKQSTEPVDKEMTDAPKSHHESKRPVVENPDGVIHFLLCELLNYREVDDKEVPVVEKDQKPEASSSSEEKASSSKETPASDGKDKKPPKPVFKAEEHPIFVYRCFLLNCLAELLQSYNRTKMEFINFKRSAPLTTSTPIKPRSTVLNYLIYDLLCQGNLSGTVDSIASKKKAATSAQTQKVLVALVAKTSEKAVDRGKDKFAYDDEPDLLFARKFVLDTMLKAYERAPLSDEPLETRYSRMQCLAELMNYMVGERDKDQSSNARGSDSAQARSHAQLRRLMYEKGYLDKLTSSIAEISLTYPGVKRAIKYILRVLRVLTETAKELSHSNILPSDSVSDNADDDIGSTSSLSDMDDDREETPDLYRNSALGMLEPRGEDDDSDEDEVDDDEDMYGDEYDDDEMDYGEDEISDEEDNISDEEEELSEMGHIEGLHGEPGVVEVVIDEDDDEDDSEEDDEDDEVESADMEDVEDHVEIVDEDGNPIDDDGNSGWESASHSEDEEDHDDDELEYVADVHDEHIQLGPGQLLDGMARAIMGDDDAYGPDLMDSLEDHYLDDGHDEDEDEDDEDEMEEDEYLYDEDYPLDDQAQPLPALGWDGISPEEEDRHRHMFMMDNQSRRRFLARVDNRSPFPPGFMVGSNRDAVGDFRSYFSRTHRTGGGQPNSDDGANPLLRRSDQGRDGPQRPANPHSIGLRIPEAIFGAGGRHGMDGPMGFLGELMEFLPIMNRSGGPHSFHLQFSGPGIPREARELAQVRGSRSEQRRDGVAQEPSQAVSFIIESTMDRYQEEARMIFGVHGTEAAKLYNIIAAKLTPAAMELERKLKAEEAEQQKREDEERKKREEEQRLAREAKEAEEKAEKERREAEAREAAERAAERAASEAAERAASQAASQAATATAAAGQGESGAMEGVESTEQTGTERSDAPAESTSNEPRVVTTIRGEEFDVTELGIDPEYLAALPEEFREEVIAQTLTTRRSQAREEATTGESTEVFQEFLDALPDELRREIAHQELQDQRRRAREDQSRQTATTGGQTAVPEMDTASILLTFPPELREQVLIDQGEELMAHLTPEMAAQARALSQHNNSHSVITGRSPPGVNVVRQSGPPRPQTVTTKAQRRTVVQMLDKAGVATLLRLMFIAQQGSIRNYLFSVFADVCENKQTRLEVISTLLQILQDGSTDMGAVERSFGQLSLKARRPKDKESEQRTPQTLKRSLTGLTTTATAQTNSETSPLLIVQQCLDLLVELSTKNPHIPWLFLTEHETVGSTLKRSLSRKGKVKDTKAHKYAINSLLSLLDRDLVMESSVVMTHLADLLNRVTMPLQNLDRRRKEAEDELEAASKPTEEPATGETAADQASGNNQEAPGDANESVTAHAGTAEIDAADEAAKKKQAKKDTAQKKLRQLQPPVIPAHNLTLAVRIFVARECSSKTFQNTISSIKNLSAIPGAKATFGHELVNQARLLSENIVADLDDLLPYIEKASSGTEIQGVALAKFSPGASEQNKLLRVLTALDHLFDSKKKGDEAESDKSQDERHGLVTSLYHNSTFSAMWEKLSACLSAIRQRENMLNVATILLPLIESLMVVCKNTTTNDDPSQNKEMVLSSPPPESRTASLFFSFTEDHRRILNELVRNNPKLMSGTFALLVKNPKVLEFDNKRNYFNRSVHSRSGNQSRPSYPPLQLSVRREQVFHDSFKSLYFKSGDEMKFGKLNIRFHGEEGVDAGGVTREWFQVLARQMFDANYVLFTPVSSDRTTFHPNKLSDINDEHLMFFKFIGRIIGKALYEGRVLDCYFSRAVYKRILGRSVSVKDMESFDPDYYKSLCWMLENDITDIITETFSVEEESFGVFKVVDLAPNGREIAVTEENKHDYVRLVVEHKLLSSVKEQMAHFLQGFHDIIPAELISIFNEQELELLISGLPDIDIDDWKSNTEYHNYNPSSQQIQWFWRALRSFDKEERAKLLQFVTGTSKVPLNGFKELEGMNGVNRFNIHRDYGNKDRLPSSHTCFNQLDLPEYESYDHLRSQILKAITAGSEYFGFA